MSSNVKQYKYVNYLWDDAKAAELEDDQVALLIYRSNILGADLRITNYGGGNTSCKTVEKDPLTGNDLDVMWIKGSGGDIGTLTKKGLAGLYVDKLRSLENVYRGLEYEDEMVGLFNHCIYDLDSKAPSIDTPLHAFLPFKHIDHLHPDAAIAIAAAKDGKKITQELFGGTIGWVEWQRPGFDLGLKLKKCLDENPGIRGIMLGSHGLFTWGDTAYESYINTLDVIEKCSEYIESAIEKNGSVFGGPKIVAENKENRKRQASLVAPILRGLCSQQNRMVGHFTDDDKVLTFINSNDLEKLAPLGTSCPDHFLRTKIQPLILNLAPNEDFIDYKSVTAKIEKQFVAYRNIYQEYYETCKHPNSPAMRDPNPVVIIYPGIGMFTFAKDKQTARVASEFFVNAINVMRGAEAISEYTALPRQEAFDIEYWLLEEAKLQRMPKPKALSGKVALVTGSGGGIGAAIAKKLLQEGACIVLNDINQERLDEMQTELISVASKDQVAQVLMDVTDFASIEKAFNYSSLAFGGVDIIVNNAGLSISKPIAEHTEKDWDILYNIMPKGQFLVSKAAAVILRKQNIGGDIINIVSKNSVVAGPNNAGYGSAKAAQAHLSRLLAAELGGDKIRVNSVNPDAVIVNSNIWAGGWAEGRAKAYGVTVDELPQYYANRTLLKEVILPEDIANACYAFLNGLLEKSTGNILNVDGGVAMGFVR
ncbi:MAG: bifunctional aldolase/short-chain dehydrogenase [Chitinophagaceae bacterium]